MPPCLKPICRKPGAANLVSPWGELDVASAFALATSFSRVVEEGTGPVIVDLCDLSFMDSTGLTVVLGLP